MDSSGPILPVPPGVDDRWVTSDQIAHQMMRLIRLVERAKAGKAAKQTDHGIERAAYVLLARLVVGGPSRSNALAEAVHSDPSTVSRQVAGLVRAGLVERRSDPEDGRASLLGPTEEGLAVFAAMRDHRNQEISDMTAHWDEADRHTLVTLLDRLTSDLEQHHQQKTTTPPTSQPAIGGQEAS
jgi:DNA-binding MarR family transcriptional regulator